MNRHFEDARYYLKRAGETALKGLRDELEPVEQRARELTGREEEPEPSRAEKARTGVDRVRATVEREVEAAVTTARERLASR
ncbi:DUF7553 family protein [Halomicrobium salinisoli]|uniref:DUF7553 family protein n=1 Tax=Halomicrobium salinisoli TaxID=2878391 RepID=UPI001CF00F5B|nr:hypothetical protein [Halomicrobium salinisoli]